MALTVQQQAALAAHIAASADMNTLLPSSTSALAIADLLNAPADPLFTVWKSAVSKNDVGKVFQASALAAITAGNNDKLANFAAWNETIYPSRADQRAFFDDVFSVAAGATTRTALLAFWKRTATRGERVFAIGTGVSSAFTR